MKKSEVGFSLPALTVVILSLIAAAAGWTVTVQQAGGVEAIRARAGRHTGG
jgi:hypothetical protein